MKVTLTNYTQNPMAAMEEAACNCYDSEPAGGRIVNSCYDSGHHSVLEFADFTFHIEGVSRALLAQITRHRHASFAVRSQRYCNEDGFGYVTPPAIKANESTRIKYESAMSYLQEVYQSLQEQGIANEDARFVLPNACETTFEMKMNGRELIHFMNERSCTCAQWEIRQLAYAIRQTIINTGDEECIKYAAYLRPKCESGRVWYCPESKKRTCGRQPLWKDIIAAYEQKVLTEKL